MKLNYVLASLLLLSKGGQSLTTFASNGELKKTKFTC